MLARGIDAGGPVPGLGRRVGRSRAARPHGGGDDRRRRSSVRRRDACRPTQALARRRARSRSCSAPRKGWRCSTARSSRPPTRWPACSRPRRLFHVGARHRRAVDRRGAGSDAPFDPRIHALRGHRGQIEVAAALRALMAGSAIRASHLRRRRPRAGPLLPALPAAGDGRRARPAAPGGGDAGDRGQRRLRQPADLRRRPARRCRAATSTPSRSPSPPT